MFSKELIAAVDRNTVEVHSTAEQISHLNTFLSQALLNFYDVFLKATSALNRLAEVEERELRELRAQDQGIHLSPLGDESLQINIDAIRRATDGRKARSEPSDSVRPRSETRNG